jgi:hypothetical protein
MRTAQPRTRLSRNKTAAGSRCTHGVSGRATSWTNWELSLLECPAFALTLLHALWNGHEAGINGFASLSALLMTYFGARFGVLGVYVTGRTREKQTGVAGEPPPSLISTLVKPTVKKK